MKALNSILLEGKLASATDDQDDMFESTLEYTRENDTTQTFRVVAFGALADYCFMNTRTGAHQARIVGHVTTDDAGMFIHAEHVEFLTVKGGQ